MAMNLRLQRLHNSLLDSAGHISKRPSSISHSYLSCTRKFSSVDLREFDARKGDRERVVILGSGWGGYGLSRQLSAAKYQTLVISPRPYFVFTPLLASTSVGTIELRCAIEPTRSRHKPNVEFIQGWADDVNFAQKTVTVEENGVDDKKAIARAEARFGEQSAIEGKADKIEKTKRGKKWEVSYDKLVVAVGCYSQTFGTKGVKENAYFLKDVSGARKIRKRILECFEVASLPTTEENLKRQLLRFVVVGGGPTGMEFAAELNDLVTEDLVRLYPTLTPLVTITVYDVSSSVLSMFDQSLAKYAMEMFHRQGIRIKTSHHVQELKLGLPQTKSQGVEDVVDSHGCFTLTTKEEGDVGVGLCVWATGVMKNPFVKKALEEVHRFPAASAEMVGDTIPDHESQQTEWVIEKNPRTEAMVVDDHLRVQLHTKILSARSSDGDEKASPRYRAVMKDVFALGDNASMSNANLPVTAQTANQQAIWLGKRLNKGDVETQTFSFKNMGIMAYLGGKRGLLQTENTAIKGRVAWLIWRGAYMTKSVSWRNKILIPTYWFLNWVLGRDITRF